MYDPVSPSTSQAIMKGLEELRKRESKTININLQIMDPVGDIVEDWSLAGQILSVNFGDLSWEKDEPVKIYLVFKPTDVKLNY
jgi:hypothetical protein